MEYSRSFALLAYVISVYYRFSAYTQIDLCTAFRTIAHFRVLIVGIFLACHSTCKIIKRKPFLSWVVNFVFSLLSRVYPHSIFRFSRIWFCVFFFFSRNNFKNRTFGRPNRIYVFRCGRLKPQNVNMRVLRTIHTLVQLSWVQFSWIVQYCCCCAVLHGGQGFSIEWCTVWLACLVAWYTWYTHSLYVCTVCAFIRKIEAYTDILSRIKPEEEKTPH